MPVPSTMQDLATLSSSNSPAGTEIIGNNADNYFRAHAAIIRSTNALASATIAAASTTDLASADAESVQVTGAATITSLGTGFNGCRREVRFTGTPTLVHSSNLILPNAANIAIAALDVVTFRCFGSGTWILVSRAKADLGYTPVNKVGDTMTGSLTVRSGSLGYTSLQVSPGANPGFLEFRTSDGTRRAYIGDTDGSNRVVIAAENSWGLRIAGPALFTGTPEFASGLLNVRHQAGTASILNVYDGNGTNPVAIGQGFNTATDFIGYIYNRASADLIFGTNNTARMTIQAGGRIQLGAGSFAIRTVTASASAPGALSDGDIYFQTV